MKTFCVFVSLCLAGVLAEIKFPAGCDHNLQCSKTECCSKGIVQINFGGRAGFCESYKQLGQKCEFIDLYGCGCQPGLACLPKNESKETFEFDTERVCKKSSPADPGSEASCNKDSECPAKDECCVKGLGGVPILDIFGDSKKGTCHKLKKEGEACSSLSYYECGCAAGFDCLFPEEDPADGASPQRVCRKKSTN